MQYCYSIGPLCQLEKVLESGGTARAGWPNPQLYLTATPHSYHDSCRQLLYRSQRHFVCFCLHFISYAPTVSCELAIIIASPSVCRRPSSHLDLPPSQQLSQHSAQLPIVSSCESTLFSHCYGCRCRFHWLGRRRCLGESTESGLSSIYFCPLYKLYITLWSLFWYMLESQ